MGNMIHRFFVLPFSDNLVLFSTEQERQMRRVLRMGAGDRVIVLDDSGWEYEVELMGGQNGRVLQKSLSTIEPHHHLTVYVSVIKWDKFEWALQKGTEIGVSRFVPVISQRSFLQKTAVIKPNRCKRWQRIIVEAAEQSHRARLPVLADALMLADAMVEWPLCDFVFMPTVYAKAKTVSLRKMELPSFSQKLALAIGPEGGFTDEEVRNGRFHQAIPVSLGKRVLRAETAVVVASALLLTGMND